jgi:hypothetical protein
MKNTIALLILLSLASCGTSIAASPDDANSNSNLRAGANANASAGANASASASAQKRPVIQGRVQKRDTNINHIDLGPNVKKPSSNTFSDISASMPAAAVHEDLRRKNELPSAQTAILRPAGGPGGGAAGGPPVGGGGAKYAAQASASQGGASSGLRGNGVASPDTKGATNQFFK